MCTACGITFMEFKVVDLSSYKVIQRVLVLFSHGYFMSISSCMIMMISNYFLSHIPDSVECNKCQH